MDIKDTLEARSRKADMATAAFFGLLGLVIIVAIGGIIALKGVTVTSLVVLLPLGMVALGFLFMASVFALTKRPDDDTPLRWIWQK